MKTSMPAWWVMGVIGMMQSHAADTVSAEPSYWSNTPVQAGESSGKKIFLQFCDACHGKAPGRPGTEELELKYQGALPAALEDRNDLNVDTVKYVIRNGFGIMAPMRKTEISDAQVQALAEYLAKDKSETAKSR